MTILPRYILPLALPTATDGAAHGRMITDSPYVLDVALPYLIIANHLVITAQPSSVSTATPFSVTLNALDPFGAVDTSYTGTVVVAHPTGAGSLGGTTSLAMVAGVATFTLTLDTVGTGNVLHITSGSLTPVDSAAIAVTVAHATHLAVSTPTATGKNIVFPNQPSVYALTAAGNLDTAFTGIATIAITGGTGGAGATLLGTLTATFSGGIAPFSGLSIDTGGADYTLTASASGVTNGVSGVFDVATFYASMTHANSTSVLPNAETGQVWTQATGTWGILGNRAYVSDNTTLAKAYSDPGIKNARISAIIQSSGNFTGDTADPMLMFRGVDTANFLWLQTIAGALNVGKCVAGTYTALTDTSAIPGSYIPANFVFQDATDYKVTVTVDEDRVYVQVNDDHIFSYILLPADATTFNAAGATKVGMVNDISGAGTGTSWKNIAVVPVVDAFYSTQYASSVFSGSSSLAGQSTDTGGFTWAASVGTYTNASGQSNSSGITDIYIPSGHATNSVEVRSSATFVGGGVAARVQDSSNYFSYVTDVETDDRAAGLNEGKLLKYSGISYAPSEISATQEVFGTPVMRISNNGNRLFTEKDGVIDAVWTDPDYTASAGNVGVAANQAGARIFTPFRQYAGTGRNTGGTTRPALIMLMGNSISASTRAQDSGKYFTAIKRALGYQYDYVDFGKSGSQTSEHIALTPTIYQPLYNAARPANIAIVNEFINHISVGGSTLAQAQASYARLCRMLRAIGFTVLTETITPNIHMTEPDRLAVNVWLRANYSTFADGVADNGADTLIGYSGAQANPFVYYSDKVHLIAPGYKQYAQATIDALQRPPFNLGTATFGTATKLAFTDQPAQAYAGIALGITPRIAVLDAAGQVVANYSGTATIAIKPGTGTGGAALLGSVTVPVVNGYARFGNIGIDTTGTSYVLRASCGALATADSAAFDVNVASALRLANTIFIGGVLGTAQINGVPMFTQPQFAVLDNAGRLALGFVGTVALSIDSGATLGGTTSVTVAGGIAQFTNVSATGFIGTATITATTTGATSDTATLIMAGPAVNSADTYTRADSASTIGAIETGNPYSILQGTFGIAGNKGYSVSDANLDRIFTTTGHNDGTFALTLNGQCAGATNVRIPYPIFRAFSVNGVTYYLYVQLYNGTVYLSKFDPNGVKVIASAAVATPDSTNLAVIVTYNGPLISVSVGGSTVLSYTLSIDESPYYANAAATQIGIGWLKLGSPSTAATFDGLAHAPLTIGAATKVVFSTQPSEVAQSGKFLSMPVVTVQDASNNVVYNYTGSVAFNSSAGALTGTTTLPVLNGAVYPYDLGVTGGTPLGGTTLTATCAGLTSATSSSFTVQPTAVTGNFVGLNGVLLQTLKASNGNNWTAYLSPVYRILGNQAQYFGPDPNSGSAWIGVDTGKSDGTFQVDVTDGTTGSVYIVVRGVDANNYVMFGSLASGLTRLDTIVGGGISSIASGTYATLPANTPYSIKLVVSGTSFTGYIGVNGVWTLSLTYTGSLNPGATIAGLWAYHGGTTFDKWRAV
jgi:hypothetical protein